MGWTAERFAKLKELAALGFSGAKIAFALGDCTRNAVIGKLYRERVARNKSNVIRIRRRKPLGLAEAAIVEKIRSKKMRPLPKSANSIKPLYVPFMQADRHHCKYVVDGKGADGRALFCGHQTFSGFSYCYDHCAIVHKNFMCVPIQQVAE